MPRRLKESFVLDPGSSTIVVAKPSSQPHLPEMPIMTSSEAVQISEQTFTKAADKNKFPFYRADIESKLIPETQDLLEKYSRIPLREQSAHVHKIRDQAWSIRAYPCIGQATFLFPQLSQFSIYPQILQRLKDGQTLLDIGCFIGHDLRRLVHNGAPSSNMYAVDIVNHWDIGFEMFKDKDTFKAKFIEADILSSNPALEELKGKIDILTIFNFLHLWDWDGQIRAAKKLVEFTKPGIVVVGCQLGRSLDAGAFDNKSFAHESVYAHTPESLEKLWEQVGKETGTRWKVKSWVKEFEELGWDLEDKVWLEKGANIVQFVVERVGEEELMSLAFI